MTDWFALGLLLLAGLLPQPALGHEPASSNDAACTVTIPVQPWTACEVYGRLSPEASAKLVEWAKPFPGFQPQCLVEVDQRPIARLPLRGDGVVRFHLPAEVICARSEVTASFHLSSARSMSAAAGDGTPLTWTFSITGVKTIPYCPQTYVIDIGHPRDVAFVGPGFSYQEGAQARPETWADDQDYRWSRNGCRVRIPIVAGNLHKISLRGHVPMGFRVVTDGVETARFERSSDTFEYTFHLRPESAKEARWLDMSLVGLDPMPLPNLDLRELFWALDKVVVTTLGPAGPLDFDRLPAISLLDAAFRASLQACESNRMPIPIALKARWDIPATYKTAPQLQQEILAVLAYGGQWTFADDMDVEDTRFAAEVLKQPVVEALGEIKPLFVRGQPKADVAVFVSRRQRLASQLRPSNRATLLGPARGAFQALQMLQYTIEIIDETDLARHPERFRCIIVPGWAFCPQSIRPLLARYVENGGNLIASAGLGMPSGAHQRRGSLESLLGITLQKYERSYFYIPLEGQWIRVWNGDWTAMLTPGSARVLLPLLPGPSGDAADARFAAVTMNDVGKGHVLTFAFDVFGQFNRYGNPQYARLLGWMLEQVLDDRLVEVRGAPSVVPTIRTTAGEMIIHLTNTARGHFDSGGLMNAARTFVFVDDVPETPPLTLLARCPQRVIELRTVPHDREAKWDWKDGRLTVHLSPIKLHRAVIAGFETPPGLGNVATSSALPSGSPIVRVEETLLMTTALAAPIETAWPVERVSGAGFLWIGQGPAEGLGFRVVCFEKRDLRLAMKMAPGHGRTDARRHLVLTSDDRVVWRGVIEAMEEVSVPLELQAGRHFLRLFCTDEATITRHPNGDTRSLLVGLHHVEIAPCPD